MTALRSNLAALLVQWKARLDTTPEGQRAHLLDALAERPSLGRAKNGKRFGRMR
jgi:hypothetical protein